VYDIVHYVSYLILCSYAGAVFHYNKDSTTYGVARDAVPLFQDELEDDKPLINELGIYILDKLCMFQCTILVDGPMMGPRYTVSQRSSWPRLRCALLSVRTTGRTTTHALLAPWTRTSGMHFKNTQTSRTRTSTTTWRDVFVFGTRSSSHQAQQSSVWETLSWVQCCQLKACTEQLHQLRNPGTLPMRPPAPPLSRSETEGPAREKICYLVPIQSSKFLSARICALRPLQRVEDRLAADRALLRSYGHDDLTPGGAHWQFEARYRVRY
jgi:hypothetical protein